MKIKQNCRFIRELTSIGSAHLHSQYKPRTQLTFKNLLLVPHIGKLLLAQASFPLTYWDYALKAATYLINRMPTPVLQMQSTLPSHLPWIWSKT